MRAETTIVIRRPVSNVWNFFTDVDTLRHWLTGFQRFEHLSGTPGQPGARSKHIYAMNGRTIEMIEEITVRTENREFSGILTNEWMVSTIRTVFKDLGASGTEITSVVESRFIPWYLKIVGPLVMKKGFQARQDADVKRFKEYVESH
jgi:uncharacterized membrane protein